MRRWQCRSHWNYTNNSDHCSPTNPPLCRVAVLATLKAGLREAEVVELPPGGAVDQRSSLVVLKGTLRTAGTAVHVPAAALAGAHTIFLIRTLSSSVLKYLAL